MLVRIRRWSAAGVVAAALAGCGGSPSDDVARTSLAEPPASGSAEPVESVTPTADRGVGSVASGEPLIDEGAAWRLVMLSSDEPDVESEDLPWGFVLLAAEQEGVVDLDRPAPLRWGSRITALEPTKTHLVLTVYASLGGCHYLAGVEVDDESDEVVIVPRLASKHGERGAATILPSGERIEGCPQPGTTLGMLVSLHRPLGGRSLRVLNCTGVGRAGCEEIAHLAADEVPLATSAEVTCVHVDLLMEAQRDLYDRLDKCDPTKEPMIGIWE